MPLILGTNSIKDTGYDVANSCRFDEAGTTEMEKTLAAGNRRTFTLSTWVKRSTLGDYQVIYEAKANSDSFYMGFENTEQMRIYNYTHSGSTTNFDFKTTQLFRDVSSWYHICVAVDTTQGTEGNRFKLYVNGTQVTAFATASYPSENFDSFMNHDDQVLVIARQAGSSYYFGGYFAEMVGIDGSALAPTSFGEFDSDSPTIWKPINVSGLTFGTNGFYLDFEDSANLGNDANGGTDFAETNLAAADQATDTPTNNFATLNPLYKDTNVTYSEGNLQHVNSAGWEPGWSTIAVSSGKWYFESKFTAVTQSANNAFIGVCLVSEEDGLNLPGNSANSYGYENNGNKKTDSTGTSYGDTWTVNDIVGCYLDLDNGAIYFSKNGTVQASGDPTSGASKTNAAYTFTPAGDYVLGISNYYGTQQVNYGNPVHSISSGNSDPNGYGNFEYDESGYYALCTKNLAEFGG